jgi:Holliday junction resolvasome RuvABC DNA-binding subunit
MAEEARTPAEKPLREDLVSALVNLGYHRQLAEKTARSAIEKAAPDASFEELLKNSLKLISA